MSNNNYKKQFNIYGKKSKKLKNYFCIALTFMHMYTMLYMYTYYA